MSGLHWAEFVRLVVRRRWLLALPVFALMGYIGIDHLYSPASAGVPVNVWDGLLATFFDSWLFRCVFVVLFVILVGDSVLVDRSSGYLWMTLSRTSCRRHWWTAKVTAILGAAGVYVFVGMLVVLVVACCRLLPLTAHFSPYALAGGRVVGFAVRPQAPGLFLPAFWLYTAFALGVFVLIPVTLSLLWPRPFVPLGATIGWIIVSCVTPHYRIVVAWDPLWRTMYHWHFHHDPARGGLWLASSVALFAVALAAVLWYGRRCLRRLDL